MSRKSIADLPLPERRFRVDLLPPGEDPKLQFESARFSRAEDARRAVLLERNSSDALVLYRPSDALVLAERLNYGRGLAPPSLASSLCMRSHRIRIVGAVWELISGRRWAPTEISTFNVIPSSWEYTPETLNRADAAQLMSRLRSDLNRCGAAEADGFLIAFLHGEFEPESGIYRLHAHGVATSGMIAVLDRLRDLAHCAANTPGSAPGSQLVRSRVVISREPLTDIPLPAQLPLQELLAGTPHRTSGRRRHGQAGAPGPPDH